MGKRTPNLFLIGAMRCGTTALHEVLDRHPDIFMSQFKEPAFFADPAQLAVDSPTIREAGIAGNRGAYLALFAGASDERYLGESSTHYTKLPRITGVAERIAELSPQARILYLMRDPVERTVSHYRFAIKKRTERRSLLDAVRSDPLYIAVSDYAAQLQPYLDVFGGDRIWVGTLETMIADPAGELLRLHRWLGVTPPEGDPGPFPVRNTISGSVAVARGPETLHRIGQTPSYQRVARRVAPGWVRSIVRRTLTRPLHANELSDPAALDQLRSMLVPRVAALETLTGRSFPEWTTTFPR